MKKILYLVVCVMALAACSNVQVMGYEKVDASEAIVTETYNLKPFEKIDVKGVANVEIKQNEEKNGVVELKAPNNYVELFKFDSKDGRLVIDLAKKVNIDVRNVLVTVYTSDLQLGCGRYPDWRCGRRCETGVQRRGQHPCKRTESPECESQCVGRGQCIVLCLRADRRHGERCGVSEVRRASEGEEHASEWRRRYLRRIKQIAPVFFTGAICLFHDLLSVHDVDAALDVHTGTERCNSGTVLVSGNCFIIIFRLNESYWFPLRLFSMFHL